MQKTPKELRFKILIEQDENGLYVASVPELEGAYTQGKTLEEVRKRIREVIELLFEEDKKLITKKLNMNSSQFFGIDEIIIPNYA